MILFKISDLDGSRGREKDEWLDRPQDLLGKYLPNNFYKLMNEIKWKEIKHAITFSKSHS